MGIKSINKIIVYKNLAMKQVQTRHDNGLNNIKSTASSIVRWK